MVSVSETVGIKISNSMDCGYICSQVENLIKKYMSQHGNNSGLILIMQVKQPQDGIMDNSIGKLETKTVGWLICYNLL